MFPLQPSNELSIPLSNTIHHQQNHKISQDLIPHDYDSLLLDFSHKKLSTTTLPPRKLSHTNNLINSNKEKMVHRQIEKQRRQEMATLHASLRSLLPLQFIKGKRSLSDQMNEAVNYINHLKKNIKELGDKRDEMKKISNIPNFKRSYASCNFTIHKNNGSVGIEITSSGFREEGVPLYKLMEQFLKEGFEVVSCFSIQVNGRLLHSLQCEIN
ncbi:transcription factor bHLH118-like isoform X2 [Cicer arietinum]|uniref:Transcription factor bHLH118-like isoform X2 n=1 Tax=Cicer arietinum TaxID=3827 RepID=A0A3Q7XYC0_CICAR|nr:transcription factor bHLH118-like isoform X2 [Cicer arietinum]